MAFNVLDKNGDGRITEEEISWRFTYCNFEGMEKLQVGEDFWSSLTRDFETDHERGITYDEFKRNMLALLEHNTPQSA